MKHKRIIAFISFILFIAASFPLLDKNHVFADTGTVEITGTTVNVRSGPGLSYSVTGDLEKGQSATVLSKQDDWLEVRVDGQEGWIASWLTTESGDAEKASGQTAVSSVNGLNVRSQPDLSAAVLTKMNAGDRAEVISSAGEWIEINFRNSRGFVSKQYISFAEASEEATLVETESKEEPQQEKKTAISKVSSFEVAVNALNVRSKPDLSSKIQETVQKGQVFPVLSMAGNWVEIELAKDKIGWVYAFHGQLSDQTVETVKSDLNESVVILTDGTNLRTAATTSSEVASRANAGDKLAVLAKQDDWYQVSLSDGQTAFVAEWVVSTEEAFAKEQSETIVRKKGTLNGLTIVLDPGHGGNDGGTVGVRKTQEKELTLKTAEILSHHLNAAGAEVVMTRQSDTYVDLRTRVSGSHQAGADAFISIHYDATDDSSVSGFTSYYQHDYQKELAEYLNAELGKKLTLHDRGVQHGNYLVLRENKQPAVLVELGFLSNFNEERVLTSKQFREQAALGLYTGIINYFDAKLEE
ncbi:SH3 domain-containing protein [Planococcus donghaensis]|uniref:N-acetylmuramoyl-L-alanine amidase n=1 Tax=Planococcus donghaensis TaxID=414778 RepID=A0A1C7EIK7_9BACL|nr:SH3 domain-containing protein [Planococcus donghaensis]ANU23565.1 N-acetylmuramoyl-L-alanine amidase [Planococcus donghaensis]